MTASSNRVQEMEVINYVYRLSQVVNRLHNGRAVSPNELDRLLEQQHDMRAAALELQSVYPELHGICQRIWLREDRRPATARPAPTLQHCASSAIFRSRSVPS